VEAQAEALLATVDEDIQVTFGSCEYNLRNLGKACGFNGIPN
jgi:hypothetical protein